jgi:SNF2 family DNA or RNA helicase
MASNEYHYGFCRSCEKPCWRRRAVQEDPVHYAIVETARSGQSCCTRGCGELIAKGSLRIGIPLKDSRGCGGAISAWTHLECTMLTQLRDPALTPKFDVETHVYGLDALDGASRASVVAEFSKEDREADKTLDPEDAAFLPQRALPRVAPPPNIALPLLPYQEEGFGWMLRRERESTGGILADEMGMGKTLQCVSLMAHDACERAKTKTSLPITLAQDEEAYGYSLPDSTLVVAPSSALWQWKDEIEKFWVAATDEKGRPLKAPSVEVYYGNRKRVTPEKLQKADVVLTSYPVLEYEYRREHARCKVKCPCCAKLMLPRKLRQHLKYMCGPYARRTAGQQKTERAAGDRAVASAKKKKKKKRGPAKPKPAKTALSFYKAATRDEAKAELPEDAPNKDIAALQTKQWKALDAAARRPYVSLAETDKARHARDVKTYEALLKEFEAQASDADDEAAAAPATQGTQLAAPPRRAAGVPTPRAIYQELMASAGRADEIIPQFQRGRAGPVPPGVAEAGAPYRARAAGRAAAPPARKRRKEAPPPPAAVLEIDEACVVCGRPTVDAAGAAEAGVLVCDGDPTHECHLRCAGLESVPRGTWFCPLCRGLAASAEAAAARRVTPDAAAPSKPSSKPAAKPRARKPAAPAAAPAPAPAPAAAAEAPVAAPQLELGETVLVGRTGHVATVERAPRPGDDEVLVRWESTGHCEDVALADVEKLSAGRSSRRSRVLHERGGGGSDSDDAPPPPRKPSRAERALADTLTPGARDGAPSAVGTDLTASRARRARAPAPAAAAPADDDSASLECKPRKRKSAGSDDDADFRPVASASDVSSSDDDDDGDASDSDNAVKAKRTKVAKVKRAPPPAAVVVDVDAVDDEAARLRAIDALVEQAIARRAAELDVSVKKKPAKTKKRKSKKAADDSSSSSSSSEEEEEAKDRRVFAAPDLVNDVEGVDLAGSLLHCGRWRRVVLDEAHRIKGFTSSTAKAAFALRAERRWGLTGTPLQNRVKELQSLVRFLKVDPYAYYFCSRKGCDCKTLHWAFGARGARCEHCDHPPMAHYNCFNRKILKPIEQAGYAGAGARALRTLRGDILNVVMLRRTKAERAADLKLPPLEIRVEELTLSPPEQDFYNCLYKKTKSRFDAFVQKGTAMHNYAHIFELLARMRQCLDHPYLVVHGKDAENSMNAAAPGFYDLCACCNAQIQDAADCAVAQCRHTFHRDCASQIIDEANQRGEAPECPTCFQPLTLQVSRVHGVAEEDVDDGEKPKAKPRKKQKQATIDKGLKTLGLKKSDPLPALARESDSEEEEALDLEALPQQTQDENRVDAATRDVCVVCLDAPRDTMLFNCGHVCACASCVDQLKKRDFSCPVCREPIKRVARVNSEGKGSRLGRASILQKIDLRKWRTSTKVEACFNAIDSDRKADPAVKSIIFSQYRTMLDLMEWRLRLGGQRVVKLTGDMPLAERKSVLARFKSDSSIAAILLSLKAGGEGLNLQEASRVYLLEPWWNPAVEMQAIQRAHRIGQSKKVVATRFVTTSANEPTIEQQMFRLQEKKRLVFEGTVDGSAASFSKLTLEDLAFLFHRGSRS